MKIIVQVKKIASNPSGFAKKSMKLVLNQSAENIATQLADRLKGFKCEAHGTGSRGTITLTPNLNTNKFDFKKSNFCCKEFENRIDLTE